MIYRSHSSMVSLARIQPFKAKHLVSSLTTAEEGCDLGQAQALLIFLHHIFTLTEVIYQVQLKKVAIIHLQIITVSLSSHRSGARC